MYETAVHRGERLDFAQNEDSKVPQEDETKGGSSFGISQADQLSQYHDDSSDDNDSVSEEDGADREPQLLNKELGFLFTAPRTRSGKMVRTSNKAVLWL